MAVVASAPLPYPAGPGMQSAQQPLDIPQAISAADKRVSQASACSGTSTNSDGKRKMQVGPWRLGRTLGRGSSGTEISCFEGSDIRSCTPRQECQYSTACGGQNRSEVGHSDGETKGYQGGQSGRYRTLVQHRTRGGDHEADRASQCNEVI